ncbi:MAG: EVE domain-containing protein [Acidobacteria bacterium]|nr:EVE domain-containing protein [Acidobacteriota bacterium]
MPKQQFWLLKSEPESFSIDDLKQAKQQTTCWDGVRNYQARNYMRSMNVGDLAFFYHSNAAPPAIVGIVEIVRTAYPDHTQFDSSHHHFDPKSKMEAPAWDMVDVKFVEKFAAPLSLEMLRDIAALKDMELLRRGSRLSVQPVTAAQWKTIIKLANKK